MIPNIVHFNYGLIPQKEEFLFVYYIAVLSCYIINKPDNIFFYYHYEPYGKWWEKTKELVNPIKIPIPTHIGQKEIKHVAHKSDIQRLQAIHDFGGIYLDIDTICYKPWKDLLNNDFVIAQEEKSNGANMGLCNAIMMSKPKSHFARLWLNNYEKFFNPDGWQESSTVLPLNLSRAYPELVTILNNKVFLYPCWDETNKIFELPYEPQEELITLHFWNQYSMKIITNIDGFDWVLDNTFTMYGKLLLNLLSKINDINTIVISNKLKNNFNNNIIMENIDLDNYNEINKIKISTKEDMMYHYNNFKQYGLTLNNNYINDKIVPCDKLHNAYFVYLNYNKPIQIYNDKNVYDVYKINDNLVQLKIDNNNFPIQNIKINQGESNKNNSILFNIMADDYFYIFNNTNYPPELNIKTSFNSSNIGSTFDIKINSIENNIYLILITRTDVNYGWENNLYITFTINNIEHTLSAGKSSSNFKYMILNNNDTIKNKNMFRTIYKYNLWGNCPSNTRKYFSGIKSITHNNINYISFLANYIVKNNIKSVLDCGCGDFSIMKDLIYNLDLNKINIQYTGIDINDEIINENKELYINNNFIIGDIMTDTLPQAELYIVKNLLTYYNNNDINKIINNLTKQNYKKILFIEDYNPQINNTICNIDKETNWLSKIDISLTNILLDYPPFNLNCNKLDNLKYNNIDLEVSIYEVTK